MVTLGQRIEELRNERGMSRPALSAALGLPKGAAEKFETGRQTPTREQQEKIADYFGVSIFYLRGESNDRTRQDDWMSASSLEEPTPAPKPASSPQKRPDGEQGGMLDAMLASRQVQDLLRGIVLETLRSAEGRALIAKAVREEMGRR